MMGRLPDSHFFASTTAETKRRIRQHTFSIDKDVKPSDVCNLHALPQLPIMEIFGGARPETVRAIPECFYRARLRYGADENSSSHLPAHIREIEIYNGCKPGAVANVPEHINVLIFSGPTIQLLQSIPNRYKRIALKNDITPSAITALPATVEFLTLLGPISAETLKKIPPSVHTLYFTSQSFRSFAYLDMNNAIINSGRQLLANLPRHVRALGVCGEISPAFLDCMPPHIHHMMVENNTSVAFASAIPEQISKVLVRSSISTAFINAVHGHAKVVCRDSASPELKAYLAERERQRQAYLATTTHKRPAEEELDLSLAHDEKKPRFM